MSSYIKGLFHGLGTLLTGLKVTGREFFTPKITEQYPENRATLKMYDRFCGSLTMPHDAEGRNRCIACGLCQSACPNGTIRLTTETVADPGTGKTKKRLVRYEYDLGVVHVLPPVRQRLPDRARSASRPISSTPSTRAKSSSNNSINSKSWK